MTIRHCYYIYLGILFTDVISSENTVSMADSKSVPNASLQHFETTQTEFSGLLPDGAVAKSRITLPSPAVLPTAFTNRIGGSKSIDVSWLFPDREDLHNGMLRINNDTDFEEVVDRFKKYLKNSIDEIARSATPHLLRTFYGLENSTKCMSSALDVFDGVRNLKEWALRMLDSNGFYPGSMMDLTLVSIGNYDMCVNTKAMTDSSGELFVGQYCSVHIRPNLPSSPSSHSSPPWHVFICPEEVEHLMVLPKPKLQRLLDISVYRMAACIPSTCTIKDVQTLFDAVSRYTSILNITIQGCEVKQDLTEKLDSQLIAWICLLGTIVGFVLICTLMDIFHFLGSKETSLLLSTKDRTKTLKSIFESFSLLRNVKKLTSLESLHTKLDFLHGIRVFTIAWVVLGHCYTNDPRLFGSSAEYTKFGPSVWFQLIIGGYFAVDTFLFTSGFLVTYFCLDRMHQQKGRFNYIAFYVNRILRISPPYFFIIGIYVLLSSLGSGPLWHETMRIYFLHKCKETWWKNMLYINNFYFFGNACSGHFWYLGAAMQLFLISPPLVVLLYRKPSLGLSIVFILTLFCATLHGMLTYFWNLPPSFIIRPVSLDQAAEYTTYIYPKPYHHGGPYFLGMALGYFLYKKGEMKLKPMIKCLGWITSAVLCLSAIYGIYPWNRGENFPQEWAAFYAACSRTAWGVGIGWIFFVCFTGNGGFVNSFLSSKPFIPISRVSFCTYLIHYIFIALFLAYSRSVQYLSHLFMVYLFSAAMFLGHLAAILCTLFFESPFIALLKSFQPIGKSQSSKEESIEIDQNEGNDQGKKNAGSSTVRVSDS